MKRSEEVRRILQGEEEAHRHDGEGTAGEEVEKAQHTLTVATEERVHLDAINTWCGDETPDSINRKKRKRKENTLAQLGDFKHV